MNRFFSPSTHVRELLSYLVGVTVALFSTSPALSCPSQTFEIRRGDTNQSLDVATLRETRPELYVLLRRAEIQDLYFTDRVARELSRMADATLETIRAEEPETQQQKAARFVAYGATEAFERFKFVCGGIVDGLAGELSLAFSKQESEHLQTLLADPVHTRFLVFMLRNRSQHKIPVQLESHIDTVLVRGLGEDLVATCKAYGVSAAFCERIPNALRGGRPRR